MTHRHRSRLLLTVMLITACTTHRPLSPDELAKQGAAEAAVAAVLFDSGLDREASYNVHRDGFVVIRFAADVDVAAYTGAVNALRADPSVAGVRAEQAGREVCILNPGRR